MRVVLDTNIVVSAAVRDRDPEAVILWMVTRPDWQWVASEEIVAEYKAVLNRDKFDLSPTLRQSWLDLVDEFAVLVPIDAGVDFPRDQKDAKFLACAQAARADYFITGDRDFSEARKLVTTTILSVSLFKKLVVDTAV